MKEMRRILALVLCFVMLVGILPVSALATDIVQEETSVVETTEVPTDASESDEVADDTQDEEIVTDVEDEEIVEDTQDEEVVEDVEDEEVVEDTQDEEVIEILDDEVIILDEQTTSDEATGVTGNGSTYVLAGSDFQASTDAAGAANVTAILNAMKESYPTMDGFLFGGDLSQSMSTSASTSGKKALQAAVQAIYGNNMDEVYVQGNHDPDDTVGSVCTSSGAHDTDAYGVYVINEKDYPWGYGANDSTQKSTIQATATALDAYLDTKVKEEYSKPIFVASHIPLHYTTRTSGQSDAKYANLLFDVLNSEEHDNLNIIFLFGHNHSTAYDSYLGQGAIYLAEDDKINIAQGSTSSYNEETLNFTYMNYGYVGYIGSTKSDSTLTMTVFEITDENVVVKRYSEDGVHNLKAAGGKTEVPSGVSVNSTVYSSPQTIKLNQFTTAALTGITVTAPAKTAYVVGDELDTTGMVVTAAYDDGSTKEVTGYDVSADLSSAGTKTVTVTYKDKTATFEVTVYAPVEDATTGVTVAAPGVTGLNVTKITEEIPADSGYSAYVSYDITPVGYTSGAATVTVPVPASFDAGKPVKVLDGDTVLTTTTIKNGTVTFTATHFSVYALGQDEQVALDWKEIPGGTIYKLDTDGVSTGADYLIVSTGTDGTAQALRNNNGSVASAEVTISNGQIVTNETDIVWTYDTSKYISNGSHFFYLSYNNTTSFLSTSSKRAMAITSNSAGDGAYTVKRDGNSYNYYLNYNNGSWTNGSSADDVYFFVKSGTGNGGYAAMAGQTVYNVITGTTTEDVLKEQIRNNLVVYTSANEDGTDATETTEYTLTGNADPTTAGEYAYTVTYGGVELGTITVNVSDVTINGISVSPASGAVTVGASDSALVGATITVDVADGEGEDFTVPLTVGMLSGNFDTNTPGTYGGLTVTYNGKTFGNFTLTVKEKVVNNYPSYPNEGAVKVEKTATGIDFQKTGVAKVELTTSGVPMNQGVDVLLVLDTSSSMQFAGSLESGTRIGVLKDCVDALIQNLKKDRLDGSKSDIDIAVVDFAGYLQSDSGTKKTNYIGSTVKTTDADDVGEVLTGGWVDVQSLDDNWGTANIGQKSGTNYDHGLEMAYNLLAQKQADNGDNTRKQFVLFMSDGAPLQYNGVNSNSLGTDWEQWILGSYTEDEVKAINTIKNPEFYYGNNNGNGQKHWVAEAIKGAPVNDYTIVYHTNYTFGDAPMDTKVVPGLGATMYSVGLALEASNMPTDVAGQEAILTTIASSEDLFYSVTSAAGLQACFDDFAGAVLYAAENAVFEDQLGASYNIQLASTTKRLVDGKEFTLDPAPTMEVREYTIWTRAELEDANGNLSEENAKKVGTRKTDENGDYIYKTLEVVSFNAAGTEAYTGGDTTTNIMVNGVISAKTFWYNNGSTTVKVDVDGDGTAETDLAPETFIWKVGTIKTTELALSYYVYLDDSLEGEASAGSYETNKYAILEYDNYLGNPCKKDTVSPQMAWLSANVSYAYYLVNAQGQPVNANGDVVTFANREIVVHPTKYEQEIKLNSLETLDNLEIASTGVLDDGNYALFDYGAKYKITVMSDSEGKWEITVGTDDAGNQLPLTTYVTDFSDTLAFTNDTHSETKDETGYDYTHTTVWFAVVWEPKALDDTVVIDYGLPVDIHVMTNDFFGDFGTLEGVATGVVTNSDNDIHTNEVADTEDNGTFGSVEVIKPTTGANDTNSVIRYTLNEENGMQMNAPEVFTYSVDYTNTKLQTNNGFYYGKLTVIPATTVYYEDNFVSYEVWNKVDGTWTKDENATWGVEGTTLDKTQAEDRPGDINFAFDTVIDHNNVYGYDGAYDECSMYSLGSARYITADADTYGTATFTFYGTGFDVVGLTSNDTGTITVKIYNGPSATGTSKNLAVDTYYGYKKDAAGNWVVDKEADNALYQVPVISYEGLAYGQYTVVIKSAYNSVLDHQGDGSYNFYMDAVRIYDPTGVASDSTTNETVSDAYDKDGEAWPAYQELRANVIAASNVTVQKEEDGSLTAVLTNDSTTTETLDGAVFIDGIANAESISDYVSYGPNNELYLAEGQAIAFKVNLNSKPGYSIADVQLGMKSANGATVNYTVNGTAKSIATSTDMYYSIMDYAVASNGSAATVTIANTSDSILSLTNIKVTYKTDELVTASEETTDNGTESLIYTDEEVVTYALMSLRAPAVEEEIPETTVPEEEVPETTVPEETEPETEETKPSKPGKPNKEDKPEKETKPSKPDKEDKDDKETKPTKPSKPNKPAKNDRAEEVRNNMSKVASAIKTVVITLLGRWFR